MEIVVGRGGCMVARGWGRGGCVVARVGLGWGRGGGAWWLGWAGLGSWWCVVARLGLCGVDRVRGGSGWVAWWLGWAGRVGVVVVRGGSGGLVWGRSDAWWLGVAAWWLGWAGLGSWWCVGARVGLCGVDRVRAGSGWLRGGSGWAGFGLTVWERWTSDRVLELIDPVLEGLPSKEMLIRYVNIALLCVEENAEDRPPMNDAISMLTNESLPLRPPNQPAFVHVRSRVLNDIPRSSNPDKCSANEVTLSTVAAR
ncbi:hypothetical protein Pint_30286 [Pistacia integerrima]|uniref:Uncharacterized protein n=1 Tax=Pistacia integerrima TaxID=434235 RepID=A0ACC0X010_9ROSI|nr:hypothetical protein Pint_30286 [Pistacia integerrima]